MADKIKITLKRSVIGEKPKNRATVFSMGLRRRNQTIELEDSPSLRGMLAKVAHLVTIEEK